MMHAFPCSLAVVALGFASLLTTAAAAEPAAPAEKPAGGRVGYMYLVNGGVTDAVVVPARHAYSHSASVGRRSPVAARKPCMSFHDTNSTGRRAESG